MNSRQLLWQEDPPQTWIGYYPGTIVRAYQTAFAGIYAKGIYAWVARTRPNSKHGLNAKASFETVHATIEEAKDEAESRYRDIVIDGVRRALEVEDG